MTSACRFWLTLSITCSSSASGGRSGERRVGEEGRSRGGPYYLKKKKKENVVAYGSESMIILASNVVDERIEIARHDERACLQDVRYYNDTLTKCIDPANVIYLQQ